MPTTPKPRKAPRDANGMPDPTVDADQNKNRTKEDQERDTQANVEIIRRSAQQ